MPNRGYVDIFLLPVCDILPLIENEKNKNKVADILYTTYLPSNDQDSCGRLSKIFRTLSLALFTIDKTANF